VTDPRVAVLRDELLAHQPVDERERLSIVTFLAELAHLEAPFDEESGPDHITASALLVGERGIVLLKHRVSGVWLQPGGHIDPGEPPWEAAWREAGEETGLPVARPERPADLVHVDVHPGAKSTCGTHLDVRYVFEAPPVEPRPPEGESQHVRWCTWAEAIAVGTVDGALAALRERGWWRAS
jgi:8-oxo-dGTP pyrophosphatase MutT (NUDIX family)